MHEGLLLSDGNWSAILGRAVFDNLIILGGVDAEFQLEFHSEPSLIPAITIFKAKIQPGGTLTNFDLVDDYYVRRARWLFVDLSSSPQRWLFIDHSTRNLFCFFLVDAVTIHSKWDSSNSILLNNGSLYVATDSALTGQIILSDDCGNHVTTGPAFNLTCYGYSHYNNSMVPDICNHQLVPQSSSVSIIMPNMPGEYELVVVFFVNFHWNFNKFRTLWGLLLCKPS